MGVRLRRVPQTPTGVQLAAQQTRTTVARRIQARVRARRVRARVAVQRTRAPGRQVALASTQQCAKASGQRC